MEALLDKEQLQLCHLLNLALHDQVPGSLETDIDYGRVIAIAQSHKVTSLLYPVLEEHKLPPEVWNIVSGRSEQVVQQSYRLLFLSRYVIRLLRKNGIDAILLKGCTTAAWYPCPELRKSGDVDILLRDDMQSTQAARILSEHGFTTMEEQTAHHHIVCESPDHISVELHRSLAEPFDSEKTNRFLEQIQKEYFEHRRTVETMGVSFELMTDGYHAFYLLLHMLQHFVRSGFGLKLLCDWVVFWEQDMTEEDKACFLRLVQGSGTLGFARMMTEVCVRYLGLRESRVTFLLTAGEPSHGRSRGDYTEELMAEIFEAEEFGKSANDRMVVLRGQRLQDYVREFHHQMKLNYPNASGHVLLYPALWVMTLCGFLYRNRTLRKVSSRKILKKARMRSRLTAQMKLFE